MGRLTEHVFGYGSLAGDLGPRATATRLDGYRRVWGVAADNRRAIPGYKQYRLRADGSVPAVFVAFLDVVVDPRSAVEGMLAAVDEASLAGLDLRERNYDRVDVTAAIDNPPPGRVWTYVGSSAGRARLAAGVASGRLAVARDYLDAVHDRPRASSILDGVPVLDLERVDLPAEPPR